jgi:hypothetical protein
MALRFAPARGAGALSMSSVTRGPAGAAATIAAGSGTALAAGATPTVTNSGTSSAATFDFGIPRGADAGIKWLYDSSTSMADPGLGEIRFNHATLSSVTAIAVSATGSGSDVSDFVLTWDDSTNTTKANLVIREEAGGVAAVFALSAVTDNTDWLQLTVSYVSGSLALTAADPLYVVPLLVGNKGIDGALAGSVGADDGGIPRADGAGGTTLQASLVAIDDSGNLTPKTTDVGGLGTSLLNWADLFLDSGAVINFDSGDLTFTHSANTLTMAGGTLVLPASGLQVGSSNPFSDSAGTLTLQNVDALDATTEATIEAAIDTLANLTSVQGHTVTLTGALVRSGAHSLTFTTTNTTNVTLPTAGTLATLSGNQSLTGGFNVTSTDSGTKSSGTFTPVPATNNFQYAVNGGAHTLAPPGNDCTMVIQYTNNASAGAITTSGFTKVTGDSFTTTNGHDFLCFITRCNAFTHLHVVALQ